MNESVQITSAHCLRVRFKGPNDRGQDARVLVDWDEYTTGFAETNRVYNYHNYAGWDALMYVIVEDFLKSRGKLTNHRLDLLSASRGTFRGCDYIHIQTKLGPRVET